MLVNQVDNPKNKTITVKAGDTLHYLLTQGFNKATKRSLTIRLGKDSKLILVGIVIGTKSESLLTEINIVHQGLRSTSDVVLRGIVTDTAHANITGTIIISKPAQLSSANLSERVLLLSDTATAKTVPNLEIEADDVKATHAATVSKIDDEMLFYMQTRGIDQTMSTRLLVESFLTEPLKLLPESNQSAKLRTAIHKKLREYLP